MEMRLIGGESEMLRMGRSVDMDFLLGLDVDLCTWQEHEGCTCNQGGPHTCCGG